MYYNKLLIYKFIIINYLQMYYDKLFIYKFIVLIYYSYIFILKKNCQFFHSGDNGHLNFRMLTIIKNKNNLY